MDLKKGELIFKLPPTTAFIEKAETVRTYSNNNNVQHLLNKNLGLTFKFC